MLPCLQTVLIQFPDAPYSVQSLGVAPTQPEKTLGMKIGGDILLWFPEFTKKWAEDGTVYTWWKKPKFQYLLTKPADGSYCQINKDGSIYFREGIKYYWSKPLDPSQAVIVTGEKLDVHVCPVAQEYFLKGEMCPCYGFYHEKCQYDIDRNLGFWASNDRRENEMNELLLDLDKGHEDYYDYEDRYDSEDCISDGDDKSV
jgi:hypothetical protein